MLHGLPSLIGSLFFIIADPAASTISNFQANYFQQNILGAYQPPGYVVDRHNIKKFNDLIP